MSLSRVAAVSKKNFKSGTTKSFSVKVGNVRFDGFVVRQGDRYFAYQNLCRHLPIALDLNDNRLLSHDGKALQCHMHGALYAIDTGICFAGPCEGDKLLALPLMEEEERLVISIPESALVDSQR